MSKYIELPAGDAVEVGTSPGMVEITVVDGDNGVQAMAWALPSQAVEIAHGLIAAARELDPRIPPAVTE